MSARGFLRKLIRFAFGAMMLVAASTAFAAPLGEPTGRAILTVAGNITATNEGDTAQFDRAMLEAIGMVSFETSTPWHEGPVKFEGVPLSKLMETVGASGDRLIVVALNEYSAEVPMEDVKKYNVILALKRDGKYMPVRDKGPLFIIYPYDSNPELRNQKFYSRSVWQVARIEVK